MAQKTKVINRLKSLKDIDGVSVDVSQEKKTLKVKHEKYHSLDFTFRWLGDHFAGYFIDGEGKQSQAVIALWTGMDPIHFSAAYSLLVDLRAKQ